MSLDISLHWLLNRSSNSIWFGSCLPCALSKSNPEVAPDIFRYTNPGHNRGHLETLCVAACTSILSSFYYYDGKSHSIKRPIVNIGSE